MTKHLKAQIRAAYWQGLFRRRLKVAVVAGVERRMCVNAYRQGLGLQLLKWSKL